MSSTAKPGDEHNSPIQNAVALAYQGGSSAPTVVAKGKGLVAKAIIERAKENGVYVHQSQELVSLLMQVDLDKDIPPALYRVVAELLAWLYHIEKQKSTGIITPYVSTFEVNPKLTP
ncbi:flagellar biosynthesis protein [Oxalobacteraceae bacterium GrIS 2.11]